MYRVEDKFGCGRAELYHLQKRLGYVLESDSNENNVEGYKVSSLYFDDLYSNAYYEKMDGVLYRKKYRIRIYNNDTSFIRLECKYKHENKTSKDQILIDKSICDKIINRKVGEFYRRGWM